MLNRLWTENRLIQSKNMKKRTFQLFFVLIFIMHNNLCKSQTTVSDTKDFPTAKSLLRNNYITEGDPDRLNAVFAKASKGRKLVIGAIGGSITQGAACRNPDKRYTSVVLDWWEKTFPQAEFELVNAGIGATGSDYGSMRVKRDLLSKSPDFVMMDYAVNDPNTKECAETYEGVVRQILNEPQSPSLLLLFMMNKDGINSQQWESKVGAHYGLPMVSYRDALWPEMQTGWLSWEQISADQVHPNETGHTLAGELICQALEKAYKKFRSEAVPSVAPILPEPLFTDIFEFTSIFEDESLIPVTNNGWVFESSKVPGWKSSVPGSFLEFEISGKMIFLSYWKINGPMGKASVSVDGGTPVIIDAWFDQTWGGYRYMLPVGKDLPWGKHKVRVELLSDNNTHSTGTDFKVLCLGSAGIGK